MTVRFGIVLRFTDPARVLLSFNKLGGVRRFGLLKVVRDKVGSETLQEQRRNYLFHDQLTSTSLRNAVGMWNFKVE